MDTSNHPQCNHEWKKAGIWDGKTPEGELTGGVWLKCSKCGIQVSTEQEATDLGGTIIMDTDVFGHPINPKPEN